MAFTPIDQNDPVYKRLQTEQKISATQPKPGFTPIDKNNPLIKALSQPDREKAAAAAGAFSSQAQQALGNVMNSSIWGKIAGGINKAYGAYQSVTEMTGIPQAIGGVVGAAGGVIGGAVGALGETGVQTYRAATGKGFDVGKIGQSALRTAKETAGFGYGIGKAGTQAAPLGAAGEAINAALAYGQGYTGYQTFKQGLESKDPSMMFEGMADMTVAGLSAYHLGKGVTGEVTKGMEAAKESKTPLRTGIETTAKGLKERALVTPEGKAMGKQLQSEAQYMTGQTPETKLAKAQTKAVETYRKLLKPSPTEARSELTRDVDLNKAYKTMSENNVIIEKSPDGKIDVTKGYKQLQQSVNNLDAQLEAEIRSKGGKKVINLDNAATMAKENIRKLKNVTAEDKASMNAEVDKIIAAEKEAAKGDKVGAIKGQDLKKAMWNKTNFDSTRPFKQTASYQVGHAIMKSLETISPKIKELNGKMGDLLDTMDVLKDSHGRVISGGKLGKAMSQMAGGIVGGGVGAATEMLGVPAGAAESIGALGGGHIGGMLHDMLTDPSRLSKKALDGIKKATNAGILPPSFLEQLSKVLEEKGIGLSIKDVSGESPKGKAVAPAETKAAPEFKGFEDLSTKILEKLKGKTTVSKQFIEDLTNMGDVKQVERDMIREALKGYDKGVPVADFAKKVQAELLPLDVKKGIDYNQTLRDESGNYRYTDKTFSSKYESIALPEDVRGNVKNYSENIYESPVKTSAGRTHFGEASDNYFGHTRIEDMADNKTRRVIEVQSDLYQKGGLEKELEPRNSASSHEKDPYFYADKNLDTVKDVSKLKMGSVMWDGNNGDKWKVTRINDGYATIENQIQGGSFKMFIGDENSFANKRKIETQSLQQYTDPTAHFRMIREEVKKAATDGKSKLQFPTGDTAMKIEGLGAREGWEVIPVGRENIARGDFEMINLNPDNIKIGMEISREGFVPDETRWIITDNLGDGKFKAIPKEQLSQLRSFDGDTTKALEWLNKSFKPEDIAHMKETFDISGKADTNNPIYKFYEKEVGKYLKSKYNASLVTDNKGVSWWEVQVKKEYAKLPVEAFGLMLALGGQAAAVLAPKKKKD